MHVVVSLVLGNRLLGGTDGAAAAAVSAMAKIAYIAMNQFLLTDPNSLGIQQIVMIYVILCNDGHLYVQSKKSRYRLE